MSDKGGKGYQPPKSALRFPDTITGVILEDSALLHAASPKGNEDNSAKSKRGRKVQFDPEDSDLFDGNFAKSNGKDDKSSKGDWSNSGKNDKTGKAGKSPSSKEKDTLELRVEGLTESTKCLMDCEALDILQGIQDHMAELSADSEVKIPSSFDRGLIYAKRGGGYTNPHVVREILEPLMKLGVSDGEICLIANVCPESVEEVYALIPSVKKLKRRQLVEEALKKVVNELAEKKTCIEPDYAVHVLKNSFR